MSETRDLYLLVTGHYISFLKERPQDWELKSKQLAFVPFEGNHSGANMAKVLVHTVNHYYIHEKVCRSQNQHASPYYLYYRLGGLPPIMPATMTQR